MNREDLIDKSEWGKGPWENEPDLQSWIDSETQYACVTRRNMFGAWLGHVGLDASHPLYMLQPGAPEFEFIETHGSPELFVGFYEDDAKRFVPPQKLWWIGFSCMQSTDYCPLTDREPYIKGKRGKATTKTYRTFEYVCEQVLFLASQLASFDARIF
jgi:hypothetical protein